MPGAEDVSRLIPATTDTPGRYGPQLAAALIKFAGIDPELRALDVGCGPRSPRRPATASMTAAATAS